MKTPTHETINAGNINLDEEMPIGIFLLSQLAVNPAYSQMMCLFLIGMFELAGADPDKIITPRQVEMKMREKAEEAGKSLTILHTTHDPNQKANAKNN